MTAPSPLSPRSTPTPATPLTLLQAELAWAEARIRRLGRELRDAGQSARRFHHHDEPERAPSSSVLRAQEQALRAAFEAMKTPSSDTPSQPMGLDAVQALFGLSNLERWALLLSAGIALQKRFGQMLDELESENCCTVELLFNFAELSLTDRVSHRALFRPQAALFTQDLATLGMNSRYSGPEQLLDATVSITGRGLELILGSDGLAQEFESFSIMESPRASFDAVVLPAADRARILAVVDHEAALATTWRSWGVDEVVKYGRGTLFLFTGPPGTGKTSTAHAIAHRLGKRLLNVDIPTFVGHAEALRFLPGLFREARLHNALLFFDECEALFASRRHGNELMTLLLTELERFEGVAVLATNLADKLDEALDRRVLVRVDFPKPDAIARERIWRMLLPPRAVLHADVDIRALALRHDIAGGYIKNALLNAIAGSVAEGAALSCAPVLTHALLDRAARDQSRRPASNEDGPALQAPLSTLADVYLPPREKRLVDEIVAAASTRRTVFERWGIAARQTGGRGVVALFHGEPGTGKTFCAEAIAGELGRPLRRVTLPSVLSKWVGEAERSLARFFAEAAKDEAVLLLDEIDGLLMQRGEARASRHDDSIVNTLLDLLDRHEGVVILCTNRPDVLDKALGRRIGWTVEFPAPDVAGRLAIWRSLVPLAATGGQELDLRGLAHRYRLSGGRIRNAVIRAASRAASSGSDLNLAALEAAAQEENANGEQSTTQMYGVGDA